MMLHNVSRPLKRDVCSLEFRAYNGSREIPPKVDMKGYVTLLSFFMLANASNLYNACF